MKSLPRLVLPVCMQSDASTGERTRHGHPKPRADAVRGQSTPQDRQSAWPAVCASLHFVRPIDETDEILRGNPYLDRPFAMRSQPFSNRYLTLVEDFLHGRHR